MDVLALAAVEAGRRTVATLIDVSGYVLLAALTTAALGVYGWDGRVRAWLQGRKGRSVLAAVAAATATPLCSCGSTAVVVGMMASAVPWAPVVAFMVASPLTSPGEFLFAAGLLGWEFATALLAASVLLGLAAGGIADLAERRGWLRDQARIRPIAGGGGPATPVPAGTTASGVRVLVLLRETIRGGVAILPWLAGFAFVGYFLDGLVPDAWLAALFGEGRRYGVLLAATLGIPFYLGNTASLPMAASLAGSGMSPGAALAFVITGAGTSVGAITGALTIARWRVVAIVVGTLWAGAVLAGLAFDAWMGVW